MQSRNPVSPPYAADLRVLIGQAFSDPRPVPSEAVAGGAISERIRHSAATSTGPLVACAAENIDLRVGGSVRHVGAAEYWSLALPWRLVVHGPLLELAREQTTVEERIEAERRVLETYVERYRWVPLPPSVLALIRKARRNASWEELPAWLDDAMAQVLLAPTIDEAVAVRTRLRMDALSRGASGEWGEESVAVAELMSDLLAVCRAAKADVDRARGEAADHGGSIALALSAIDDQQATAFETTLALLVRPAFGAEDMEAHERKSVLAFAARREPCWAVGLLGGRTANPEEPAAKGIGKPSEKAVAAEENPDPPTLSPEAANDAYYRIRHALEQKVIGRPALCRHLALIGAAHVVGVTHQRVLLVGPSGSGKTHAGRSLAESLAESHNKPFMEVNATDLTAVGWRGGELNDLLDDLAQRSGGSLDGAILLLNEIDKAACLDSAADGNSREAKLNLQSALLGLCEGSPVSPDSYGKKQLETAGMLVVGTGAFGGRFAEKAPSTGDLVEWGWMAEFAGRWGERICLAPVGRSEAVELLRRSENAVERRLGPLIRALGIEVKVTDALLGYVADAWLSTGTDFRSASEWVLAAARRRLIRALEVGSTDVIVLAPDDIVPPVDRRRP